MGKPVARIALVLFSGYLLTAARGARAQAGDAPPPDLSAPPPATDAPPPSAMPPPSAAPMAPIPGLPTETAIMGEIGYDFDAIHVSPILHAERLWSTVADQSHLGGGLALWSYGHNANPKAFYTRNIENGIPHADNQFNLQSSEAVVRKARAHEHG